MWIHGQVEGGCNTQQKNLGNNSIVTGQGGPDEMDACHYQNADCCCLLNFVPFRYVWSKAKNEGIM